MNFKRFATYMVALSVIALGVWACSDYSGRSTVNPSNPSTIYSKLNQGDSTYLLSLSDFNNRGVLTLTTSPLYAPQVLPFGYVAHTWIPISGSYTYTEIYSQDPSAPPAPPSAPLSGWTGTYAKVEKEGYHYFACGGPATNCKVVVKEIDGKPVTIIVVKV